MSHQAYVKCFHIPFFFRQPVRKPSLKIASAQVVETSVTNNSPSQDSYHPDDLFQSKYATPGFKPFSCFHIFGYKTHPDVARESPWKTAIA